jgi:hypothetical protein
MSIESIPAAAIVFTEHERPDGLLAAWVADLQARGRHVRGLLQLADTPQAKPALVDVATGMRYPLFQNLGAASGACSVDTASIADASAVLRQALTSPTDLVVINRFGPLECEGGGFAAEMLALMSEGVPLLTAVAARNLDAWRAFTGGSAAELPPQMIAFDTWFTGLSR